MPQSEAQKRAQKRYCQRNRAKLTEYARAWRQRHKERLAAKARERYWSNPEPKRAKAAAYREAHPDERAVYIRRYMRTEDGKAMKARSEAKHPEAIKARRLLNLAVRKGTIVRQPCSVCGNPKSHGHHEDYTKPYDVVWYCQKHHLAAHGWARPGSSRV